MSTFQISHINIDMESIQIVLFEFVFIETFPNLKYITTFGNYMFEILNVKSLYLWLLEDLEKLR